MSFADNNLLVCDLTSSNTDAATVVVPMTRATDTAGTAPTSASADTTSTNNGMQYMILLTEEVDSGDYLGYVSVAGGDKYMNSVTAWNRYQGTAANAAADTYTAPASNPATCALYPGMTCLVATTMAVSDAGDLSGDGALTMDIEPNVADDNNVVGDTYVAKLTMTTASDGVDLAVPISMV